MSALRLARLGLILLALFAIAHALGMRDDTSFLSGTAGGGDVSWEASVAMGTTYLVLYFAAVLAAPTLLIASALLAVSRLVFKPRRHP
jgi:hypothetical protein